MISRVNDSENNTQSLDQALPSFAYQPAVNAKLFFFFLQEWISAWHSALKRRELKEAKWHLSLTYSALVQENHSAVGKEGGQGPCSLSFVTWVTKKSTFPALVGGRLIVSRVAGPPLRGKLHETRVPQHTAEQGQTNFEESSVWREWLWSLQRSRISCYRNLFHPRLESLPFFEIRFSANRITDFTFTAILNSRRQ